MPKCDFNKSFKATLLNIVEFLKAAFLIAHLRWLHLKGKETV